MIEPKQSVLKLLVNTKNNNEPKVDEDVVVQDELHDDVELFDVST